ncbi:MULTISPECIES: glycosyltransferase family 2 protein [Citrobacter freundii complex]|uniref:glycosyltransferase family 2 protein n=1 Tax=Citrobacter freundii complex TaxID=1344959 RepID=UPI0006BDB780|nr:glycosyltransferase family 2 protein [Citrobacter portucalensis]ALD79254.1 dTDP-rhamnosyl transferase RfbF [Citrobacter portucalensis]MBD9983793.1 glycosyltransferase family 2 protein [Citrobacter portucalensis]MBE0035353.1 glycosyltransferase family 2 protein [Citrobacter portucalensis]MBE0038971.1 glycosyltransferase family 2 protein [Citrobacter portucalensis]MBE0043811.1 glycosyltransferase family 2 protein [Citrobacter portucalensis]
MFEKICGVVIVFYHPNYENINNARKLSEYYKVTIVDNSEKDITYSIPKAHIIKLNKNLGIATALNIGINYFIENEYKYVALLDQDSEPDNLLLDSLINYFEKCTDEVCLVAPSYYDRAIDKNAEFILCTEKGIFRQPAIGKNAIEASYVITSGSVLKLSSVSNIGSMDDNLFIDFVDIEWCLRANSLGYKILGLPWLKMSHEIGDDPINIFNRKYVNHSPIRHYYYFRNIFLLMRMSHVHPEWKKWELIKLAPRFLVYACFTKNRMKHISAMLTGICHGLLGRTGKKK